jgi:hypothetical protein
MLAMTAVMALLPRSTDNFSRYEMYMMGGDGNVYLRISQGSRDVETLHPDRSPVLDPETGRVSEIPFPRPWNRVDAENREGRYSYREVRRFFQPWMVSEGVIWYWTAEGQVMSYDVMTRRVSGRLEPNDSGEGFLRPVDRGIVDVWQKAQTVLTQHAVYHVEPDARNPRVLYQATAGDRVVASSEFKLNDDRAAVVVVTERRIVMVTAGGEVFWDMAYEPGQPDFTQIQVFSLAEPGEYGVIIAPSYQANQRTGWNLPYHAVWISESEGIRRHVELPALRWPEYQQALEERMFGVVLSPMLVVLLAQGLPQSGLGDTLLFSLGGAMVSLFFGWGIGRRRKVSLGRQAAWSAFHLVFGLPGLLASVSVWEWPAYELCPECKRKRPIDEEKCRHCGAGFAPPERNGTEIFEPLRNHGVEAS